MRFPKDILLIDFETTKHKLNSEPLQIGAVLLDRNSLEEKDFYTSLIKSDRPVAASDVTHLTLAADKLPEAPSREVVAQAFIKKFGFDVILSSWVYNLDRLMLDKVLASIGKTRDEYDYHCLDLWPVAYIHLLKNGYTGSLRSEEMFLALGLPPRDAHDALEDCRHEADILRKIMQTKND